MAKKYLILNQKLQFICFNALYYFLVIMLNLQLMDELKVPHDKFISLQKKKFSHRKLFQKSCTICLDLTVVIVIYIGEELLNHKRSFSVFIIFGT